MGGVLTSGSAVVSEPIYKFFQALYDEEAKRFAELESRARLYFSVASLYVGAIAFKFDDVVKLIARVNLPAVFIVLDGALFIVAILFCVLAMQVRGNRRSNRHHRRVLEGRRAGRWRVLQASNRRL